MEEQPVAVVEGIPEDLAVAEDRSADAGIQDGPDDQLALEANNRGLDSFSAPDDGDEGDVAQDRQDSYGSPQAPVIEDGYGAPQAPLISAGDSYGSPLGAPIGGDSYGSPQGAPIGGQGPIPVPLPLPVNPASIVIPEGPQANYGGAPQYRPPPPQRPAYRPPPQNARPPPPKPSYGKPPPPPPKPQYSPRPKPQYSPRPVPVPVPQPKPQYSPRPQAPSYNPAPKPQYRPPQKPAYGPPQQKPAYNAGPRPQGPPPQGPPPQLPPQQNPGYNPAAPAAPAPAYTPVAAVPAQPSYGVSSAVPQQQQQQQPVEEQWPKAQPDMPKITSLDVTCEKNLMKVFIEFDKPFYGIIFSKGHYSDVNCVHLPAGLGRTNAKFDLSINSCGTTGNTENGLYGYGSDSGSGTFFENTIVVQYDPQVQEVWDQARKLRCTWHDQYEKSVTFRPFPVDMLDVVSADFAGDNVGCWMQIQVGKGPWASEVSGLVKIGQTMTMVLAIKDDENKFDMLVRNCMAHDGKRAPIQLVDQKGCVTRPKLMSRFSKIKNFGASASVLSYAHFQAFKFPDSMEVHFQCTIQICRYQCPDQCEQAPKAPAVLPAADSYGSPQGPVVSSAPDSYGSPQGPVVSSAPDSYGSPQGPALAPAPDSYGSPQQSFSVGTNYGRRRRREAPSQLDENDIDGDDQETLNDDDDVEDLQEGTAHPTVGDGGQVGEILGEHVVEIDLEDVGVQKVIQVVSSGDLTFAIKENENETTVDLFPPVTTQSLTEDQGYICMSTPAFAATLVILLAILVISCLLSAFLCLRHRSFYGETSLIAAFANPVFAHKKGHF